MLGFFVLNRKASLLQLDVLIQSRLELVVQGFNLIFEIVYFNMVLLLLI